MSYDFNRLGVDSGDLADWPPIRSSRVNSSLDMNARSERRIRHELCIVFSPLASQARFNALRKRIKGFSGPVGSGKSAALCFECVRQAFLNRRRQGLLAAPTYSMLRDATLVSLFGVFDGQEIDFELRKSDGELDITHAKSIVLLRSLEEPERLRGTNLAWFGVDELSFTREEGWLRLEARLRDPKADHLCGFGVWTPQGHDWLYKRFIHKPVKGYGCVRAKPFENHYLLANTPDYYERLESSYDPRFYKQEVLGEYLNSKSDRVYHCFDHALHVTRHSYDPAKALLWSLDFNVSPMSSVVLQQCGEKLIVIDEIVLDRATSEEACQEFENRYKGHMSGLEIFGDASGKSSHTTGASDYNIVSKYLYRAGFRNVRIRVPTKNPAVLSRVQRVNALLTIRLERCG